MSEHHDQPPPSAISAALAAPRRMPSSYPEAFALRMAGRSKQPLGEVFGLAHFGVNLTTLAPGAVSALHHAHSRQDEFVYVLLGRPLLRTGDETTALAPGMCAGWRAGSGIAHQLFNPGPEDAVFLEVGDRTADDQVLYPEDDLVAILAPGGWRFTHKDGTPYDLAG